MRQFDALAAGCVPLIIRVRYEDCKDNGGELEQAFEEVIPWDAFSLYLNRSQIPQLESILRSVPEERIVAMRRVIACVWPRLFWLHRFAARDTALEPTPRECGRGCQDQLRAAVPSDAFSTFLWLLRRRHDAPGPTSC